MLGNCHDSQNAMIGPSPLSIMHGSSKWEAKKKLNNNCIFPYLANKVIIGKMKMSHLLHVPIICLTYGQGGWFIIWIIVVLISFPFLF